MAVFNFDIFCCINVMKYLKKIFKQFHDLVFQIIHDITIY